MEGEACGRVRELCLDGVESLAQFRIECPEESKFADL